MSGDSQVGVRERSFTRGVVGMEQAAQGSGHWPELLELMERLDNALTRFVF